jgi:hypothetical protein
MPTFNERFIRLLKAKDIRPSIVAKKMGVSRQVIDNYLGTTLPGFCHLVKILEAFPDVSLRWLILGQGDNVDDESCITEMYLSEINNSDLQTLRMLLLDDRKEVKRLRLQNDKLIAKIMEYEEKQLKQVTNLKTDIPKIAEA